MSVIVSMGSATNRLQRDVAVLFGRQELALGAQRAERADHLGTSLSRPDNGVHVPSFGSYIGVGEGVFVLGDPLRPQRLRVGRGGEFAAVEDVHRTLRAHD